MKSFDIILALYIFSLVASLFNATIFLESTVHTQGIDTSNINATITDYQNKAGATKEQGWLESFWTGGVALASSIGFVLKLFLTPLNVYGMLVNWGISGSIAVVFSGILSIVFAYGIFLLITNRNSKWME